jgi:hypothetical protein
VPVVWRRGLEADVLFPGQYALRVLMRLGLPTSPVVSLVIRLHGAHIEAK